MPALNTELNKVVETWHTPPPTPSTNSPSTITGAFLYPLARVVWPTTLLKENSSPGINIVPSIALAASDIFSDLPATLELKEVENSERIKFIFFISSVVLLGTCP